MKVAIYQQGGYDRARVVCDALRAGIRRCGDEADIVPLSRGSELKGDAIAFYGFQKPCDRLMAQAVKFGVPAVHVDLGYWGRTECGRLRGYHKVVLNSRHPTAYFQRRAHAADRIARFGLKIKPWQRNGRHILICGASHKHAAAMGYDPGEWEANTIAALRKVTDRPIRYRPKPSDLQSGPIAGTEYARGGSLEAHLSDCHALVTMTSNTAVDALVAGVPVFCEGGVASVMSSGPLTNIEKPSYPDGRDQFLADLAYCQWNMDEIEIGKPWMHFRDEGLIP